MGCHDRISKRSRGFQGLPAPTVAPIAEMFRDDAVPTLDRPSLAAALLDALYVGQQ